MNTLDQYKDARFDEEFLKEYATKIIKCVEDKNFSELFCIVQLAHLKGQSTAIDYFNNKYLIEK